MKLIIAGTRTFNDYELLSKEVDSFLEGISDVEIVSGGAKGADALGEKYASEHNYPITKFPANWEAFGSLAGPARNRQMADYADACIVFWDYKSPGTRSMIEFAKKKKITLKIVKI